ncbi:uncharacterized protein LOC115346494 isoform X5 [Aquila chrysaetos chrysaetos]|uniref:uncharacterized protein LOC115346494 isoform X5 n=1 Tax=Aquila chrysaetos chrysaetos TaxID=223781 RepID=UPI001B7D3D41|nr:uncharacterized protein LOC115346494 isoform X5 [Aquila chrysaetos chrysaetos]
MEVRLAGGFLRLLLLAWLRPAELAYLFSATIDVSVGLDLVLQCLLQTGLSSTAGEVKWFNTTQNEQNKGGVEMKNGSAQLVFTSVSKAHTGTYACRMENMRNMSRNRCSQQKECGGQPGKSVITMECMFQILLENHTVHVKSWYKDAGLEVGSQTNTTALGENCTNVTGTGMHAANMEICGCAVFITTINLTGTVNGTQGCGLGRHQSNVTEETWTGKLTSKQVAEGDQLSTAAPVTGTEDLTYVNLKFEKKGTKPAASDVVYTEIKPSQQKQSSRDASAANKGVDVSPEGEGK